MVLISVTYLELTCNIYVSQILTLCSHTALLDENATSHKFRARWNPLSYSSYPLYSVSIALHGGSLVCSLCMADEYILCFLVY